MGSRRLAPVSEDLFAKIIDNEEEATAGFRSRKKVEFSSWSVCGRPARRTICPGDLLLSAAQFSGLLSLNSDRVSVLPLEREYGIELGYSDEEVDVTVADPRTANSWPSRT